MMPENPFEKPLTEIKSKLVTALDALDQGRVVKLPALDAEVAKLTQAIIKAPPAQARAAEPLLRDMVSLLETYEIRLSAHTAVLKERLK
jgi:hypothetical protein